MWHIYKKISFINGVEHVFYMIWTKDVPCGVLPVMKVGYTNNISKAIELAGKRRRLDIATARQDVADDLEDFGKEKLEQYGLANVIFHTLAMGSPMLKVQALVPMVDHPLCVVVPGNGDDLYVFEVTYKETNPPASPDGSKTMGFQSPSSEATGDAVDGKQEVAGLRQA